MKSRSVQAWRGKLYLAWTALVLVSMACSLPFVRQTPTTVTQAPTLVPLQPVRLPPAVVEADPLPGTTLSMNAGVQLFFNQPMERLSVEGALKIEPAVGGRFEWTDDSSVTFLPDQTLPAGSDLRLTIAETARAANGIALQEAIVFDYTTAELLRVTQHLPEGNEVDPLSAVVVAFNQPVVALGAEAQNLPVAFTLEPTTKGKGEWLNTSTYIFYPESALAGATNYIVRLNPDLVSVAGSRLAEGEVTSWQFTTTAPSFLKLSTDTELLLPLDEAFEMTFNQPMDRVKTEAAFSLTDANGKVVEGKFEWKQQDTVMSFKPLNLLKRDTGYTLRLTEKAAGLSGAALENPQLIQLWSSGNFALVKSFPDNGEQLDLYERFGFANLQFGSPIKDDQDLEALIRIDPPVEDLSLGAYDKSLNISGVFDYDTTYTVTIKAQLQDRWGGSLVEDQQVIFWTANATPKTIVPMLQLTGQTTLFIAPWETTLPVQTININRLDVFRYNMEPDDLILLSSGPQIASMPEADRWQQALPQAVNQTQTVDLKISRDGLQLLPGIYGMQVRDGISEPNYFNLIISRVHLTLKRSPNELFIWAANLETQAPVAGARLTIYNEAGTVLGNVVTDQDGKAVFSHKLGRTGAIYVVTGKPGEPLFGMAATNLDYGLQPWQFGADTLYQDQTDHVYLYTDRPIYRPGQTVAWRGALHVRDNGRYYLPTERAQIGVAVYGPYDENYQRPLLFQTTLPLSGFGTFDGVFELSPDAQPGMYAIDVEEIGQVSFQVANYRKPEVELSVSAPSVLAPGVDLGVGARAQYYFGAPAGNLPVKWSLYAHPEYIGIDGYQVGPLDQYPWRWYGNTPGQLVASGEGITDKNGMFAVSIAEKEYRENLTPGQPMRLTIEFTVQDENGQQISGRAETIHYPEQFLIGVRSETWTGQAGTDMLFSMRTFNWEKQAAGSKSLTVVFQQAKWERNGVDSIGRPAYQKVLTEVGRSNLITDSQGQVQVTFIPPAPGVYQLDVSSGGALTQLMVWVTGSGVGAWPRLPDQHIELQTDAQEYGVGQTAHVLIPNPFEGEVLGLVTIERGLVMRSQVIRFSGPSYDLGLLLTDEDAPNIYISVFLLRGGERLRPDFRFGLVNIKVRPDNLLLQLAVTADPQRAGPGDKVKLTLEARNARGEPVQGEFSLSLVDKALLALTDANAATIDEAFYGQQPLEVWTSSDMAVHARRIERYQVPFGRGGGGAEGAPPAPEISLREDFRDTAYWNATVLTDDQGRAVVDVTLPDNLTTWVVLGRGLTRTALVGEVQAEVMVTRELLVRPVTPRFMVAGDHVQLAAVVHNNSLESRNVQVALQSDGFVLDDASLEVQTVLLPPGEHSRVTWWGKVKDVDSVELIFSATAGELSDSARPVWGNLPVLRYVAPLTFGTSGVVMEGGRRLEAISLPRSYTPTGGMLQVELAPSLAATILGELPALEAYPYDYTEAILSRLLPNVESYRILNDLKTGTPETKADLKAQIEVALEQLSRMQNRDGGWGWQQGSESDAYLTAYALFGFDQARRSGFVVPPQVISNAQSYLEAQPEPGATAQGWELDRAVFQDFALAYSGSTTVEWTHWYEQRSLLSPWAQALTAWGLAQQSPGSDATLTLLSDLQALAQRSATGVHWQGMDEDWHNFTTPNHTTAIVLYVLATLDPANPLVPDVVRYLVMHRKANMGWGSSYETSWVILALGQVMRGTGDLRPNFQFSAALNDRPILNGTTNGTDTVTVAQAIVPLADLQERSPSTLVIERTPGSSWLYYRAYLQLNRPVADASAVTRGLQIERQYYAYGEDCRMPDCEPLQQISLSAPNGQVSVRLTVTVPKDMYYVAVEDIIPAGMEVLDLSLKTSQQGGEDQAWFDPRNPFGNGWGWWWFDAPQVYDMRVQWMARYLPAGTYELTYRLLPVTAGEYQVLPARAWMYFFPEVEGLSSGTLFEVTP
jgi:uncharacterized protein YfaS (alpha-2-macroglobulin family)